jgi:hypothetical protein
MSMKLKIGLCVGFISLLAFSLPACSDDDDNGGTAKGGTAGTGGASGGAAGSGGGASGSAGAPTCAIDACESFTIGGALPAPACCAGAAGDKCGALFSKTVAGLLNFPEGCYELDQPGTIDCGCPTFFFKSPLDQSDQQFDGCCSSSGECGLLVNITSQAGPDLGCVPLAQTGQPTVACTSGSETPPPPDADGGTGRCPNPDAGAAGAGGGAGAVGDASTD